MIDGLTSSSLTFVVLKLFSCKWDRRTNLLAPRLLLTQSFFFFFYGRKSDARNTSVRQRQLTYVGSRRIQFSEWELMACEFFLRSALASLILDIVFALNLFRRPAECTCFFVECRTQDVQLYKICLSLSSDDRIGFIGTVRVFNRIIPSTEWRQYNISDMSLFIEWAQTNPVSQIVFSSACRRRESNALEGLSPRVSKWK